MLGDQWTKIEQISRTISRPFAQCTVDVFLLTQYSLYTLQHAGLPQIHRQRLQQWITRRKYAFFSYRITSKSSSPELMICALFYGNFFKDQISVFHPSTVSLLGSALADASASSQHLLLLNLSCHEVYSSQRLRHCPLSEAGATYGPRWATQCACAGKWLWWMRELLTLFLARTILSPEPYNRKVLLCWQLSSVY